MFHKFECRFLKGLNDCAGLSNDVANKEGFSNYTMDYTWLLLRALIRRYQEYNGLHNDEMTFSDVSNLCSNATAFSEQKLDEFMRVARVLKEFICSCLYSAESAVPNDFLPPATISNPILSTELEAMERSLLELICKEECNSFGLYTFSYEGRKRPRQSYGVAIYPHAIYFNHSCCPNVGHVSPETTLEKPKGGEMIFYAVNDMEANVEACISYVALDDEESTAERRGFLKDVFHFDCDCQRCVSETKSGSEERGKHIQKQMKLMLCNLDCKGWFIPKSLKSADSNALWVCEACGRSRQTVA